MCHLRHSGFEIRVVIFIRICVLGNDRCVTVISTFAGHLLLYMLALLCDSLSFKGAATGCCIDLLFTV